MTREEELEIENKRLENEVHTLSIENRTLRQRSRAEQRLVLIESPFAGDVDRNTAYARSALRDSLLHGEAPFASHLLYTQPGVLRDEVPVERLIGIDAGLSWGTMADATVVYQDLGISAGMEKGIYSAQSLGRRVEYRRLPGWTK